MRLIIYLLLMLKDCDCVDYPIIETKTVYVGEHVKMTCSRRPAGDIYWIRIDSGNFPESLDNPENRYPHIKVWPDVGNHVLQISKARLNDSGFYFCLRKYQGNRTYMKLTSLTVKEAAATTNPTSAPPHLHGSVTLHCSALSDSQNKSCPEDENLLCFRAESIQTFSGLNYIHSNEEGGYEFTSEGCFYSYFKNSSLSDAQTYHCAVVKHAKDASRGKSNPDTKGENKSDSRNCYTIAYLLSAALGFCLIIIAFLIHLSTQLNKKLNDYCNGTVKAHEAVKGNQESPKSNEDLVYSTVSTRKKPSKKRTGDAASEDQDVIYTEVNVIEP